MAVNLSVKGVPDEIAERLREQARRNHRSLQGELMAILEESVMRRPISVQELNRRVKKLGLRTPSEARAMIREDRDARQGP